MPERWACIQNEEGCTGRKQDEKLSENTKKKREEEF